MTATTAYSGHDGSIAGPTGMSEVIQWKLDLTEVALDGTSMASNGWEETIGGLKGGAGTASTQGTVVPVVGLTAATLKTKSSGGATFTGSIRIRKVTIGVPVNNKVTYDSDFVFTGSIALS